MPRNRPRQRPPHRPDDGEIQEAKLCHAGGVSPGRCWRGGGHGTAVAMGTMGRSPDAFPPSTAARTREEADRFGCPTSRRRDTTRKSMVDFMKLMRRHEFYSNNIPSYFLTHPGTSDRIRYLDGSSMPDIPGRARKASWRLPPRAGRNADG